jgi:glycosyltransferase involved in cell wall biosynthesis
MSIRVLHITNKWEGGGVERYVETLVRAADPSRFDMGIASVHAVVESGASCEKVGPVAPEDAGPTEAARAVGELVTRLSPDIVHIHTNNGTGLDYARAAAKAGARIRVVHSHNSAFDSRHRMAKRVYTDIARARSMSSVTCAWACSVAAGRHLFGKLPFEVMRNGIDVQKFAFDREVRTETRSELGIPAGAPVLGFAARFTEVKNPLFALDVFAEFRKAKPDARMIFLGDGPLAGELHEAVSSRGLENCCHLMGYREDPERFYPAMDALIAPSLYEGLPINLVEAQACGLVILASDSITDEVTLRQGAYLARSLGRGPGTWVDGLDEAIEAARPSREPAWRDVKAAGYDADDTTERIFRAYEEAIA